MKKKIFRCKVNFIIVIKFLISPEYVNVYNNFNNKVADQEKLINKPISKKNKKKSRLLSGKPSTANKKPRKKASRKVVKAVEKSDA